MKAEINAGSMADIAFLLLIFFLVTTTIDSEQGLMAKLPRYENNPKPSKIPTRNVLAILINSDNQIMVNGDLIEIEELKKFTKNFILNENNSEDLPQKKTAHIPLIGKADISKHVISLKSHNETNYKTYINVRNELISTYNELRNEAANQFFGTNYEKLKIGKEFDKLKALKTLYPQRISEAEPF